MKILFTALLFVAGNSFALDVGYSAQSGMFKDTFVNVTGTESMEGPLSITGSAFSVGGSTLVVSGGKVGVGTASPSSRLDVITQNEILNGSFHGSGMNLSGPANSIATSTGVLSILDNTPMAADVGGSIVFEGDYINGYNLNPLVFSGIKGGKTNGSDYNSSGYLSFWTRYNGFNPTEKLRINDIGNVGIGTTAPGATLDVVTTTGVEVSTSTTATAFFTIKGGLAKAAINLVDPATAGEVYFCTDCTAVTMCVSTGTAVGSFVKVSDRSAVCD